MRESIAWTSSAERQTTMLLFIDEKVGGEFWHVAVCVSVVSCGVMRCVSGNFNTTTMPQQATNSTKYYQYVNIAKNCQNRVIQCLHPTPDLSPTETTKLGLHSTYYHHLPLPFVLSKLHQKPYSTIHHKIHLIPVYIKITRLTRLLLIANCNRF